MQRRCRPYAQLVVVALLVVITIGNLLITGIAAQTNTTTGTTPPTAPTGRNGSAPATANTTATTTPAATPTPTPTVNTYAVPAPSAMPGSTRFAFVKNVQCTDVVANASFQIYSNNRALFDACVVEGKYQIFPYGGTLPTQSQVDSMVRSTSCRSVFTACVLANLPQCDIGGLALKSATETLLKIAIDVLNGQKAPDAEKFFELLLWRRDVNLAQVNNLPYDQDSQLYGEYSRNLWKALTTTNVKVSSNLTISFDGSGSVIGDVFANVTSGTDASNIVGKVGAADTTKGGAFSNNATNSNGTETGKSASASLWRTESWMLLHTVLVGVAVILASSPVW